jgi:hypothetical protein
MAASRCRVWALDQDEVARQERVLRNLDLLWPLVPDVKRVSRQSVSASPRLVEASVTDEQQKIDVAELVSFGASKRSEKDCGLISVERLDLLNKTHKHGPEPQAQRGVMSRPRMHKTRLSGWNPANRKLVQSPAAVAPAASGR